MNATETARLRELVQTIRHDGVTVLLIEHDVKLVMGPATARRCSISARRSPRTCQPMVQRRTTP